jgi:glycosyltransferase involved in cell wall biosynthesis
MLDRDAIRRKSRLKKHAYLALVGRTALHHAAAVHFSSFAERENCLIQVEAERCIVVPNAVVPVFADEAEGRRILEKMEIAPDERFALFLGRLSQIKGIDLLPGALSAVLREIPRFRLVIAGPDSEGLHLSLRQRFEQLGVDRSVSYVGMVENHQKTALLNACEMLVAPSYLESFGMSIAEAMASSKPVVVTDRVSIGDEIQRQGAGLVVACDQDAIAHAMVRLARSPETAAAMGAKGKELVRTRFGIDSVAAQMASAMERIVRRRESGSSGS